MTFWNEVFFAALAAVGYIAAPVSIVWGWKSMKNNSLHWNFSLIASALGLALSTSSATLAMATIAYAQVHHFGFYDPQLLRIFRWGILLSTTALLLGLGGVWQKNAAKWSAPISAIGMISFWLIAAAGE